MDISRIDEAAFAAALADLLTIRKNDPRNRMTYDALSEKSGVKVRQLKYLLSGTREMSVTELRAIAGALGLEPGQVVDDAVARAVKMST